MYVALNEASLQEEYTSSLSRHQGIENFHGFLDLMSCLIKAGLLENLFIPINFSLRRNQYILAKDYSLQNWIDDKSIERKYKSLFFTLIDKYSQTFDKSLLCVESKFIHSDCNKKDLNCLTENDIHNIWCNETTISEGASCLIDYFYDEHSLCCLCSISNNHGKFSEESLQIISLIIIDNNSERYEFNEFFNLSGGFSDFNKLDTLSKDLVLNNISSGSDLWEIRAKIFPNLIFCENVKKQLDKDYELFHIKAVVKRLNVLQDYFSKKHSTFSIDDLSFNARDESESVKNNTALSKLRFFRIPNGKTLPFYYHMDLGGKYGRQGRLHFYPDLKNNVCYIGYIGKHLSTEKYKC